MTVAVHCDGCGQTVAEFGQFPSGDDYKYLQSPPHMWIVKPPDRDLLKRYEVVLHLCNKACLWKWASKQEGVYPLES
jgi:hypothetical protein